MNKENEKKYQNIINTLDWNKIHKEQVFSSDNFQLWVYADGITSLQTDGTCHNPESGESPVLYLGTGVESVDYYLDGWAIYDSESEMVNIEDGRILTIREAIEEAIDDGDWSDLYDEWKREIREFIERDEKAEKFAREAREEYDVYLRDEADREQTDAEKLADLMNKNPAIPDAANTKVETKVFLR